VRRRIGEGLRHTSDCRGWRAKAGKSGRSRFYATVSCTSF
jgi:hypothetical protein